ncbi:hypothetical protein PFISCL1PPCAC_3755 [Pristionchus fissidentatus]|uniref:Uncharacterized protein n=1 Tax=Pristionchus fissidentatus TaxID=1538716 RepID=A0AAV5V219_9BILA|nr:hypothetical protein PFISCL1PPCAC_3755 [Pristionchus fissidentatus]
MDEMNELLAIVAIVVICCVMFLAWLLSMAMCPDTMVNILSGKGKDKGSGSNSSYRESRELIRKSDESVDLENGRPLEADFERGSDAGGVVIEDAELVRSVSAVLQLNQARALTDKKLSVVDEVDEQLTLQSTIHSGGRPSILKHPVTQVVVETHPEPSGDDV